MKEYDSRLLESERAILFDNPLDWEASKGIAPLPWVEQKFDSPREAKSGFLDLFNYLIKRV